MGIDKQELMKAEIKELWEYIKSIQEETGDYDEGIEQVKKGIDIMLPIWYITEEWYDIYPSSKRVKIMGFGKLRIQDFMEEKDRRSAIMRSIIIDYEERGETIEER